MSTKARAPRAAAKPAAPAAATMTRVTLARTVTVAGHDYKPGHEHTVDAATLAAFGDAVLTAQPVA